MPTLDPTQSNIRAIFAWLKVYMPKFKHNVIAYTCQNVLLSQLRRKYQNLLSGVMTSTTARPRKNRWVQATYSGWQGNIEWVYYSVSHKQCTTIYQQHYHKRKQNGTRQFTPSIPNHTIVPPTYRFNFISIHAFTFHILINRTLKHFHKSIYFRYNQTTKRPFTHPTIKLMYVTSSIFVT